MGLSYTYNILTRYHNASLKVKNKSFEFENNTYSGTCFQILITKKEKIIKDSSHIDFDEIVF